MKFLYKEEIDYASLSEPFDRPFCENGEVYIIPKGKFEKGKKLIFLITILNLMSINYIIHISLR